MKCLPATKVTLAQGTTLHDWHAEIVAMRAFNFFLLQECSNLLEDESAHSSILRRRLGEERSTSNFQPFAIKDGVMIFMYSSEAPCGDASMELVMSSQEDATPWTIASDECEPSQVMKGRGYFSELGIVRRKPSRADAPETLSKSCSDKFSMRECTSMLSSLSSLLIHPGNAYLHELVLPRTQCITSAIDRAFGQQGRMSAVANAMSPWSGGYIFHSFHIIATSREFCFSRRRAVHHGKPLTSNVTAMWTPTHQEVLVGGRKQGFKQFSRRGSSATSKAEMWRLAVSVSQRMTQDGSTETREIRESLQQCSYSAVKSSPLLQSRKQVKDEVRRKALHMWVRNDGGEAFNLDE